MRLTWLEHKRLALQLECFELTPPQYLSLVYMAKMGPACTMGQLAEQMHQSSATVTGIVDRLCRRGLAERRQDVDDRRRVHVVLTTSGRNLLTEAVAARRRRTVGILQSFTEHDRARLVELMQAYLAHAEDRADEPSGGGLRDA